ncbi:MAG: hypothetical protein KGL74_08515 [Elusimicrobia bacterium]|nr:hypothetical protein [Elusimicrobiota bacterium]
MTAALLALLLVPASAAEVSWTISGDTAAAVGAEAVLVYRPSTAPGSKLEPDALASGTTSFAVVKAEARPDGSWAWTILPLDEGTAGFVARWKLDGRETDSPPASITARAPQLPKDADIEDIKGPLAARRALWPWLLAAVLGALAWEAWRRWKARPAPEGPAVPTEPPLPPEIAAENALAELAASQLWERGEHAAFYLRLTDILRAYLEARFDAPASAMTSVEVARLVKAREPGLKSSAIVRELLSRADLVKFARIKPAADEGLTDIGLVRDVVKATTRAPSVPQEAPR